jgi:hypothetical protein
MILNNNSDLKKYVSISSSFIFSDFEPYISKAINKYIHKYVGNLHIYLEKEFDSSSDGFEVKNEAREYLRSAISNFGYFLFTPYNSILMDSSGMSNINNDQRKPIEWWQLNDIRRDLLASGHDSMDLLLEVLENNSDLFPDYSANYSTINSDLLVHSTSEFQKAYNIYESRQTFLALLPTIRQVEDQYIKTFLSSELLAELKSTNINENLKPLKRYLQTAVVLFTISKVYDEGIFILDASGIRIRRDILPNEKTTGIDGNLSQDKTSAVVKKHLENATNYIILSREEIENNPSVFSGYENPLLQKVLPKYQVYNTKGLVGL